ncbi:hypothetical protein C8R43DRAFT_943837 [Mycena crocata]|nr:hypothetical protein C8R43DRAFT_943837 [Mycena crocata]
MNSTDGLHERNTTIYCPPQRHRKEMVARSRMQWIRKRSPCKNRLLWPDQMQRHDIPQLFGPHSYVFAPLALCQKLQCGRQRLQIVHPRPRNPPLQCCGATRAEQTLISAHNAATQLSAALDLPISHVLSPIHDPDTMTLDRLVPALLNQALLQRFCILFDSVTIQVGVSTAQRGGTGHYLGYQNLVIPVYIYTSFGTLMSIFWIHSGIIGCIVQNYLLSRYYQLTRCPLLVGSVWCATQMVIVTD